VSELFLRKIPIPTVKLIKEVFIPARLPLTPAGIHIIISIVILLPAINFSCFVSNAAVNSACVISPIAQIILEVIPLIFVIISIVTLLPAVNLSCFVSNAVSILTTDEDKLLIPLSLELILPFKVFHLASTSTPFIVICDSAERVLVVIEGAVREPLATSKSPISGGLNVILSATISLSVISIWSVIFFSLLDFNDEISPSLSSILPFAESIALESPTIETELAPTKSNKSGVLKGNTPAPYTDAFKVATADPTPDIFDELELILPSKLYNLAPTSTPFTVN
jgi:hypothetical protein